MGQKRSNKKRMWARWLSELCAFAMRKAEVTVDTTADYWRSCFESGMSPEQAFRESFVEQDGI